ncbi:MAG: response regulator [bacterium]|nr:response regulator [bacterium]MDT8366624.1 response regulator [bacterium]
MRTISRRIITVDDINEFIQREETLLRREDLNFVIVKSGEEALFRARNDLPDLLILNFYMPDVNGYQVCRKLKADSATEHIPILILTTPVDEDNDPGILTEAAGCNGCIEKPIQQDDMVPLIVELIGVPPRRHLRTGTSLPCSITDEDGKRDGTILNLTPNGLCLETAPAPWPGDIVKGELSLDGTPATFQMAVRWSRESEDTGPGRAGCEFLGAPPEVLEWLEGES